MKNCLSLNEINEIKTNFEMRNIEFEYFESDEDLIDYIKKDIAVYQNIGIGNSQTLKRLKITDTLLEMHKTVFDKTLGTNSDDIKSLKKKALLSECYITSSNAISKDGIIVNVDHSGNRVAAMTYGPERVLIIVGINKIVQNEKEAINRALKVATPQNALRSKIPSPCSTGGKCLECNQTIRVCNHISIIRGQNEFGRMKVMLLNESLGF